MSDVKERMIEVIQEQPEDSSYEEILKELALVQMVDRGLRDSRDGKTISNEDMKRRIDGWRR